MAPVCRSVEKAAVTNHGAMGICLGTATVGGAALFATMLVKICETGWITYFLCAMIFSLGCMCGSIVTILVEDWE